MAKYARSWNSMQDHGTVCNIMAKYARSWQSMQDHGKVCNIMAKYAISWQSMQDHGKVCKIMAKMDSEHYISFIIQGFFASLYKFFYVSVFFGIFFLTLGFNSLGPAIRWVMKNESLTLA